MCWVVQELMQILCLWLQTSKDDFHQIYFWVQSPSNCCSNLNKISTRYGDKESIVEQMVPKIVFGPENKGNQGNHFKVVNDPNTLLESHLVDLYLEQYQMVRFQEMCLYVYWPVQFIICKSLIHKNYQWCLINLLTLKH